MKSESRFLFSLAIIIMIVLFLSSFLTSIIKTPDPEVLTFNYTMHDKLIFDGDDIARGTNSDSNLTFAMFMHFKCPGCAALHPIIQRLMVNHPEVNFLFKHAIDLKDEGEMFTAKSFECAKLQGNGYDLAEFLYGSKFKNSDIIPYLQTTDLNMQLFLECMDNADIDNLIEADSIHALYLNVRGTPTVFLNGIKIEGAYNYEVYNELIEAELKNVNDE